MLIGDGVTNRRIMKAGCGQLRRIKDAVAKTWVNKVVTTHVGET